MTQTYIAKRIGADIAEKTLIDILSRLGFSTTVSA